LAGFAQGYPHLKRAVYLLVPLALIGAVVPGFLNTYVVGSVLFLFLVYSVLALSYDLLGGFTGYMNLGHVVFFGIGAYVAAIVFKTLAMPLALGIVLAPIIAAGFALLVSFPIFRLKGFYFAVAGLALVELASLLVASSNAKPLTNGFDGISFIQSNVLLPYYAALGLIVFSVLASLAISESKFGIALRTIKEDEQVAGSVGINVPRMKRRALIISALIGGLDGAIYFWGRGAISPQTAFGFAITFIPITLALLGGTGTTAGPIIGGVIYIYLQNYLLQDLGTAVPGTVYFPNAITGILLIAVGLFAPRGIVGSPRIRGLVRWAYGELRK
jgi:branched-chain amino acid transport system permease protein